MKTKTVNAVKMHTFLIGTYQSQVFGQSQENLTRLRHLETLHDHSAKSNHLTYTTLHRRYF